MVKILPGYEWYDGILYGLCIYEDKQRYFHWMEGGYKEAEIWLPTIYFVYDIDYIPKIEKWEELEQFNKIGEFKDEDISEIPPL